MTDGELGSSLFSFGSTITIKTGKEARQAFVCLAVTRENLPVKRALLLLKYNIFFLAEST
jgi:hypothetical protein